jgi:hypothetical protein
MSWTPRRPKRRTGLVLAAVGASLALAGAALGASGAAAAPRAEHKAVERTEVLPAEIAGTARLLGCAPDPSQLRVVAEPLNFRLPGVGRFAPEPGGARHVARVATTGDPHVLSFSILGLRPNVLYRLGVMYPADLCGKVFWRGPFEGLVVAGAPPIALEGVAARTTVEVLQRGTDEWLGGDDLHFADAEAAQRRFRWRSTLDGVVGGELQVAIDAFPTEGAFGPCDEPEGGVVYRKQVAASEHEWIDIGQLDFRAILSPRRAAGDGGGNVTRIDLRTYRRLVGGQPIYVRVVPQTPAGPACDAVDDGVSGWVLLGNASSETFAGGPPSVASKLVPGDGNEYLPPYTGGDVQGHPTYAERAYKVIKDHTLPPFPCVGIGGKIWAQADPLGCMIVNAGWAEPGAVLKKGPWFYYKPASSSGGGGFDPVGAFTNSFGNLVTAGYSALGLLLETASTTFNEIKQAVVKVVVKAIEAFPGGQALCNAIASKTPTSCASLVETGITVALTSAGIPPSIPNWEQLKQQGIKYVTSEIATEIANETGGVLPPEVTQPALEEIANRALEAMTANRGGEGPQYDWVLPYAGFEPASLLVSVHKPAADVPPGNLVLGWPKTPLYSGGYLDLPRVFPDDGELSIPIVLQPNLDGFNAPICLSSWYTDPQIQCLPLLSPGAAPICRSQSNLGPDVEKNPYKVYDCSHSNYPALYYRDRWVNERLDTVSSCTPVSVSTRQWSLTSGDPNNPFDLGVEYSTPPLDWRFTVFASVKPRVHAVWNGATYNAC